MEGIDPEYSYYSWAKSFELVRSGKHQVAAFWACSLERPEYFYCSDSIGKELLRDFNSGLAKLRATGKC